MRNILLFVTIFSAIALIAGCGDGKLKTIKVTGTVTLDGVPLPGATVNFTPKTSGQGDPAFAITDAAGKYALQTLMGNPDAGTTPGDYAVYIIALERSESEDVPYGAPAPAASGPPRAQVISLIHEGYTRTDTSGLSATVASGSTVHNFELKSTGP